jgi:hypothetical protein
MTHLSSNAVLVNLTVSQWVAKKLDKKASNMIADQEGADRRSGNYNKSLLPTCTQLDAVKQETALIRKDFYQNTLPWTIEGTFILPSANYLAFITEYRGKKAKWIRLVNKFLVGYDQAHLDAQRLLGGLYNAKDYPTDAELTAKFSMDMKVLPVPAGGDFRTDLPEAEAAAMRADVEKQVAEASTIATKEVWQRLYDKVSWLQGRLADPKNAFYNETFEDAKETCKLLKKLNFTGDADLEKLRFEAEHKLFKLHPQAIKNDPVVRNDTAAEAKAIMEKMSVFMGGLT